MGERWSTFHTTTNYTFDRFNIKEKCLLNEPIIDLITMDRKHARMMNRCILDMTVLLTSTVDLPKLMPEVCFKGEYGNPISSKMDVFNTEANTSVATIHQLYERTPDHPIHLEFNLYFKFDEECIREFLKHIGETIKMVIDLNIQWCVSKSE